MSKVFFDVGVSLDGYVAGPNRGPGNPLGDGGLGIHAWAFQTRSFLGRLGLAGGEPSPDDGIVQRVFERAGAYVMGKRMFEEGEVGWPENAPFRTPVFVLSHTPREPWPRPGGTTFTFVTDGLASALERARAAAGGKDVRIAGGAETIREYLRAGLVDEFTLHVAPVMLGDGIRLLEGVGPAELNARQVSVASSPHCTHVTYQVVTPTASAR